ncbi:2,3-diaminopropionate biosynthesis protein SbnA [Streptomyces sp. NPDC093250]|uniref:2,3-diaminopropionate biosynthesis protein SbnA n=1 Tax=Streptomyces sp. NPDC093250 TaxID=3366036 RepID=UPI003812739F
MIYDQATDVLAGDQFLELPGYQPTFTTYLKLEGMNPAGSIKVKPAREMIRSAEAQGRIGPGSRIIESTSGNMGVALASICATRGYHITLVTDPNANARTVRFMQALGAEVVSVTDRDRGGGYLNTRIDYIKKRTAVDPQLVWLNQYANPGNADAHRKYTVREIVDGFGFPDWLFLGTGTSGTLMGCVRGLRELGAPTTVVAVDAAGSVTFGFPSEQRRIPGIGASRRPELFVDDGSFLKTLVAEPDTIRTCRRVAREYGLLLGGSSGSALSAVSAMHHTIAPGSRVLTISPDMGDAYLDTIYNDQWVAERYGASVLTDGAALDVADPLPTLLDGTCLISRP